MVGYTGVATQRKIKKTLNLLSLEERTTVGQYIVLGQLRILQKNKMQFYS